MKAGSWRLDTAQSLSLFRMCKLVQDRVAAVYSWGTLCAKFSLTSPGPSPHVHVGAARPATNSFCCVIPSQVLWLKAHAHATFVQACLPRPPYISDK